MKALIWIGGLLLLNLLNILLGYATGFRLGNVLIFLLWSFLAAFLCRLWNKHLYKKSASTIASKAATEGLSVEEYLQKDIPEKCIEMCDFYIDNGSYEELKTYLSTCLEDGNISKEAYKFLINKYCQK